MINWKYIKGLREASDRVTNKICYTFLGFQCPNKIIDNNNPDFEFNPILYVNNENNWDTAYASLGHIITQSSQNQHIDTRLTFNNGFNFSDQGIMWSPESDGVKIATNKFEFCEKDGDDTIQINIDADNQKVTIWDDYTLEVRKDIKISEYLNIGDATTHEMTGAISAKTVYSDGICEAKYFNSTSDRRAKTDLKPLNINALDLINNTQLYSFKYKDLDLPSIGIIAQDIQNINIEGFKLVDNENATGQDMDYMSIHESKLVYILWKAIKEQQKEIEELKKRLN